jgi:eukaryotic-like serine/threonine-protein kinase
MTGAPAPGEVLADKYRIEEVLGAGGMGVVVAATHLQLHVRVAIKLLRPDVVADQASGAATERLLREARAMAQIKSDHVARILDVGTLATGAPYIVMEHLAGTDLAKLLRTDGRPPLADVVTYVLEACEAVHEAHALGIIHRDLKPSNLFLTRGADGRRRVKVLDFGLSKIAGGLLAQSFTPRLTTSHAMLGSPLYMSPEQLENGEVEVDARTDVWALGAILYELVAGRPPFEAKTFPQLCTLILHGRPRSLDEVRPAVPAGLAAVIGRCLEKLPSKRYETVRQLAVALAKLGLAPPPRWLDVADMAPVAKRAPAGDRPARRRGRAALATVVVATALVALAVGFAARRRANERRVAPVATDARPDGGGAPGAASPPCSACVVAHCADDYRACRANRACARVLESYNACVDERGRARAGVCAETLGTNANAAAQRLASCVFVQTGGPVVLPGKCADTCAGEAILDAACIGYCACMRQTCSTLDADTCLATCAHLSPEQTRCRSYHCFLAKRGDPQLHCQHAVGRLGMCP